MIAVLKRHVYSWKLFDRRTQLPRYANDLIHSFLIPDAISAFCQNDLELMGYTLNKDAPVIRAVIDQKRSVLVLLIHTDFFKPDSVMALVVSYNLEKRPDLWPSGQMFSKSQSEGRFFVHYPYLVIQDEDMLQVRSDFAPCKAKVWDARSLLWISRGVGTMRVVQVGDDGIWFECKGTHCVSMCTWKINEILTSQLYCSLGPSHDSQELSKDELKVFCLSKGEYALILGKKVMYFSTSDRHCSFGDIPEDSKGDPVWMFPDRTMWIPHPSPITSEQRNGESFHYDFVLCDSTFTAVIMISRKGNVRICV